MDWISSMQQAIGYIEDNITEDLKIEDIANQAYVSSFYFQKAFSILCGFTVGEYIRRRRLSLAGSELLATDIKVIDVAIKYGYDSPDSFAKAFNRFHGITPSSAKKEGAMLKSFAPLKIKFTLEGGNIMDYRIEEKSEFTVMGTSKIFDSETSSEEIPKYWTEHYNSSKCELVCGEYGICIDELSEEIKKKQAPSETSFEYIIADNYNPQKEIPQGFVTRTIPAHTWAVFPCRGPMPSALQEVNTKIYSEWLPNCKEYEIAGAYNVEMYTDCSQYEDGNQNPNYYSEIWIPIKKK